MDWSGRRKREVSRKTYTPEHIRNIVNACGIVVDQETVTNYIGFCPFHENTHTPALSIDKRTGRFICFNHACNEHGGLYKLINKTMKLRGSAAERFIIKHQIGRVTYAERKQQRREETEWPSMPQELLERMEKDLWESPEALDYLMNVRGFNESTLRHFRIGYSRDRGMVVTPMFDVKGNPLGVIGRSIFEKRFNNSKKLPRGHTLWNLHNAKKHSTCIVVEANFDGLRVHQAGFPNVVAVLGGHFSDEHAEQLARYFDTIIIMTDDDDVSEHTYDVCRKCDSNGFDTCQGHNPGRDLGNTIAREMLTRSKQVKWAMYDDDTIYPAKDPADMSDSQVRQCILNAVSDFRYKRRMESMV